MECAIRNFAGKSVMSSEMFGLFLKISYKKLNDQKLHCVMFLVICAGQPLSSIDISFQFFLLDFWFLLFFFVLFIMSSFDSLKTPKCLSVFP
uniref:Uncharacterized protein n=1 Tax=Caenorhabditis japonica TaxID=281687 RepID=A0A8R1IFA0_CAEJA